MYVCTQIVQKILDDLLLPILTLQFALDARTNISLDVTQQCVPWVHPLRIVLPFCHWLIPASHSCFLFWLSYVFVIFACTVNLHVARVWNGLLSSHTNRRLRRLEDELRVLDQTYKSLKASDEQVLRASH